MNVALMNAVPCASLVFTEDGIIADVNERMCKALNFSKEDLLQKHHHLIFPVATKIFFQTHLFPLLRMQGFAEEIFITLLSSDGNDVPFLINASRELIDDRQYIFFAGIVVKNRKKFEDELLAAKKSAEKALHENTHLQEAKKELQKQAKLLDEQVSLVTKQNEELREFSRVVTHDMQEPIRKISLFTNLITEKKDFDLVLLAKLSRVVDNLQTILRSLQQYIWLTESPSSPSPVSVESIVLLAKSRLEKEHSDLRIDVSTRDLPQLKADREQIEFLFYELLSNAVRFRKGDHVSVNLTAHTLMLNEYRVLADKYNYVEFYNIQVEDNGSGFDEGYREKVFSLFKGVHEQSGRGVGLALCKKIVENHHGKISIQSKKGSGTTVNIFWPTQRINNP